MIETGPVDKTLQAGENLMLNCTGINNMDATQNLTINWIFTALDRDNTQKMFTVADSKVMQVEVDEFTITSFFTISNVMSSNSGEYTCVVFNRESVQPVNASATVTVFCKFIHYLLV